VYEVEVEKVFQTKNYKYRKLDFFVSNQLAILFLIKYVPSLKLGLNYVCYLSFSANSFKHKARLSFIIDQYLFQAYSSILILLVIIYTC